MGQRNNFCVSLPLGDGVKMFRDRLCNKRFRSRYFPIISFVLVDVHSQLHQQKLLFKIEVVRRYANCVDKQIEVTCTTPSPPLPPGV